jgi:hypothetical protein
MPWRRVPQRDLGLDNDGSRVIQVESPCTARPPATMALRAFRYYPFAQSRRRRINNFGPYVFLGQRHPFCPINKSLDKVRQIWHTDL